MKLSKSYIRQVIREEIQKIVEQPEGQDDQGAAAQTTNQDAIARTSGQNLVKRADAVVAQLANKIPQEKRLIKQIMQSSPQNGTLAIIRALMRDIVEMEPQKLDKMLQLLKQATKQN